MQDNSYNVLDLVGNINPDNQTEFTSTVNSNLGVKTSYHKVQVDTSWIDIFEDTIRYIDNILRNPRRFIVNEEDIVKVEKSKKVTVESVIHLSQHTNLITDYNEQTGEVRPSKILNIMKEETLDTYENRFIYSLIINMMNFINRYGAITEVGSSVNSNKQLSYEATAKKGHENINISVNLNAAEARKLDNKVNGKTAKQRIDFIRERVVDFTGSELYKDLARMHVSVVRSPIRKTNVILKNPNFQRAEALWNYMERFNKDIKKETNYNRSSADNPELKNKMDLSFLIDYSLLDGAFKHDTEEIDWDQVNLNMLKSSIKNYLDNDPYLAETKFLNLVKKEFKNVKKEQEVRHVSIRKIIEKDIGTQMKKIDSIIKLINNI